MKTLTSILFSASLLGAGFALLPCQAAETNAPPASPAPPPTTSSPSASISAQKPSVTEVSPQPTQLGTAKPRQKGLILNFRGAPLDMVLNYLSDAAGFVIVVDPQVKDIKGKVDVWSSHPVSKDEAVNLLNTILKQNGYAAIRNGQTLKIITQAEAKTQNLPVNKGANPADIPNSDQMVTQIIPVRYADATKLTTDLQPLLPTYATLTANESGNALVLTDTQANVRRMTQIVSALDTSISSIATVRVFPLRYADAKTLADAVTQLFQPPNQQNNNNDPRARFFARFGRGNRGNNQDQGNSAARTAATHVVAVADERSNSLVVSAPDDFIPTIEQLVKHLDVSVADITELKVFHLKNADPTEVADMFSQLFPDQSNDQNNNNRGRRFRFFRPPFMNGGNNSNSSQREQKETQVIAVADPRTSSVVVSASSQLMPQITDMIEQLDSSSPKKQEVFVYSLKNADVVQVQQILQDMFQRSNIQSSRNNANQTSALLNRQRQNTQNQGNNSGIGFGNSSFGNSRGVGGLGGR